MKLFPVHREDFRYFEPCLPKTILNRIKNGECRLLGVTEQNLAVGAVVYSTYHGNYCLDWIYVVKSYRRKRYATALLSAAIEEMMAEGDKDALMIRYDVAEPPEGLEELLKSFVFEFHDTTIPVYTFNLSMAKGLEAASLKVETEEIVPISKLLLEWKNEFEKRLYRMEDAEIVQLPIDWNGYSKKLSVARVCQKRIEGVLLVKEKKDAIEISLAYACRDKAMTFMLMVLEVFRRVRDTFGEETTIYLAAVTDFSKELVEKLFPEAEQLKIREGYYALK